MENRICIKCREEINPLRLKALPTTKTCVNCSTIGTKKGMPITFGEKDHTWTDMVIMEPEEYDRFEKQSKQNILFDELDKTETNDSEDDDDTKLWDNTLTDGLEDL